MGIYTFSCSESDPHCFGVSKAVSNLGCPKLELPTSDVPPLTSPSEAVASSRRVESGVGSSALLPPRELDKQMQARRTAARGVCEGRCHWLTIKVCVCVCVHPWTKGFPPLLLPQFFNHLFQPPSTGRGVEQACRAPLNKALCSVLRISARTLADVPAPETVAQAFPLTI